MNGGYGGGYGGYHGGPHGDYPVQKWNSMNSFSNMRAVDYSQGQDSKIGVKFQQKIL